MERRLSASTPYWHMVTSVGARRLGSRLSMGYAVGQNCTLIICIETIFVNFILVSCNMRLSIGT